MIKKILDFIFTDLFVLITTLLGTFFIWLMDHYLFYGGTGYSIFQVYAGIMLVMIPIMMILLNFASRSTGKMSWNKRARISNYISAILIISCGYLMMKDFKDRPLLYEKSDGDVYMSETDRSLIFEFHRSDSSSYILSCDKSLVKYNSINELEFYESYKIDMFGKKTPGGFCVKSYEMENYVYPNNR